MLCCCKGQPKEAQSTENLVDRKGKSKAKHGYANQHFESQRTVSPDSIYLETRNNNNSGNMDAKMAVDMVQLIGRLESVTSRLEGVAGSGGSVAVATKAAAPAAPAAPETVSAFVTAYDDILSGPFSQYMRCSGLIGGDVMTQAEIVSAGFQAQREFLVMASRSKEPSKQNLVNLLKPTSDKLVDVQNFRETHRGSKLFNHLSAVSESIAALGWVTMEPAPGPYVKEMSDASQFYTNRVLKEYKEKDATHANWVKAWLSIWRELQAYIKTHHTTGVTWNRQGGDAGAAPAPGAGGAPPPPPPPPVEAPAPAAPAADSGDDRAALFSELNKGTDVTKGLKKVTDDMKTHKNPALKLSGPTPYKKPTPSPKPSRVQSSAAPAAKPPKTQLDGKKWIVEYHDGNKNIVISDTNIKQGVYIFKCTNSTIQIKGKVNGIVMDNCKKSALVFENAVSSVEFINSQSVQCQILGKVPTVSIDKTDGCMVYLSNESINAEIVTAKSSEMNILVPTPSGEFKEFAVPEQFKTKWNGKSLTTAVTDIA